MEIGFPLLAIIYHMMGGRQESLVMTPKGYAKERVSRFWSRRTNERLFFSREWYCASHFTAFID
jgi:hypothetical protein